MANKLAKNLKTNEMLLLRDANRQRDTEPPWVCHTQVHLVCISLFDLGEFCSVSHFKTAWTLLAGSGFFMNW